jgi:ABC-2 type transport system permease protein
MRSQLAYPTSFAFDLLNQLTFGLIEFTEIYVIFHNVPRLAGLDWRQALLVMALARTAFTVADLVVGHLDQVPVYLREGTLEMFLVRPLPVLAQVVTSDISLRRLARVVFFAVLLGISLAWLGIDWTAPRVAVLAGGLIGGCLITCALFVAAGAVQFWLIEGGEAANAFTYGGAYASQYPAGVLPGGVRWFYVLVIPVTFMGYLPAVTLLGLPGTALPAWLGWLSLPVGMASLAGALGLWRLGLRHYQGGGG